MLGLISAYFLKKYNHLLKIGLRKNHAMQVLSLSF